MSVTDPYGHLMATAAKRQALIGIEVGPILKTKDKFQAEYRAMTALVAQRGDAIVRQDIVGGDLLEAALQLAPRLP